jgi:hypothetical protein
MARLQLQRIVHYVTIAHFSVSLAINVLTFCNLKPDLAKYFTHLDRVFPIQRLRDHCSK